MTNPFQFGRELAPADLVDRDEEIATCVRTIQQRERLFMIGPRRYGKTSILRAASETVQKEGRPGANMRLAGLFIFRGPGSGLLASELPGGEANGGQSAER